MRMPNTLVLVHNMLHYFHWLWQSTLPKSVNKQLRRRNDRILNLSHLFSLYRFRVFILIFSQTLLSFTSSKKEMLLAIYSQVSEICVRIYLSMYVHVRLCVCMYVLLLVYYYGCVTLCNIKMLCGQTGKLQLSPVFDPAIWYVSGNYLFIVIVSHATQWKRIFSMETVCWLLYEFYLYIKCLILWNSARLMPLNSRLSLEMEYSEYSATYTLIKWTVTHPLWN